MESRLSGLRGSRVFVTGHTGFKGSWLIAMLNNLGAVVGGYALDPPTTPSLFAEAELDGDVLDVRGDIRDYDSLHRAMRAFHPDVVIHLAAQPLVLAALRDPMPTFASNVQGTVHCLDAVRRCDGVRALLVVTSDKCYRPVSRALREGDALGGHDPYSASKACAELVVDAYRRSYLAERGCIVASARAGNVIGGGDWSPFRLVADLARAAMSGSPITLRHPGSIRPWQHVTDALRGYLAVAQLALKGDASVARAWNFGPQRLGHLTVAEVVERFCTAYGVSLALTVDQAAVAENPALMLDSSDARRLLSWIPTMGAGAAVDRSATFYRRRARGEHPRELLFEEVEALLAAEALSA